MFELIYPVEPAPLIPGINANNPGEQSEEGEFLPVVEQSGLVVGRVSRSYCHNNGRLLHPVVHLFIIDRMARLYLQKRSMEKAVMPGLWDCSAGGHVDYGETLVEALMRESCEELKLTRFNPVYIGNYVYESESENELVAIFAAVGSFVLTPAPEEISEGRYWSFAEVDKSMGKGVFTPEFEIEFRRIRAKLLSML